MTGGARSLILLAGICLAVQADLPLAQRTAPQKPVYDQYEPSRVLMTGRQGCMRNEDPIGAYCVRNCQKGYLLVPNSNPPRCRSIDPLPPGQLAGPIRKEAGSLPKPPQPAGPQQPPKPSGMH